MNLRPPTATIDDPFFAAVRRRHLDVDVVLIPPAHDPDAQQPVSGAWAAEIAARVVRGGEC